MESTSLWGEISVLQVVLVSSIFLMSISVARAWAVSSFGSEDSITPGNNVVQSQRSVLTTATMQMDEASLTKRAAGKAKDSYSPNTVIKPDRELVPNTETVKLKSEIRILINELNRDFPESNEPKVLLGMMYRQHGDHANILPPTTLSSPRH